MSGQDLRIARLEYAVDTLAAWLVDAQTGFGKRDAEGIFAILDGKRDDAEGIVRRLPPPPGERQET